MTVSVQTPYTAATANGVTTVFPYSFKILDADDLEVTLDGVVQTTGFTVSGVGDASGNVTFTIAPANGVAVLLARDPALERDTDYAQFGKIPAAILNADFDRIWLTLQKFANDFKRALKLPINTAFDQLIEDTAAARASTLVSFDSVGNLTTTPISSIPTQVVAGAFTVDTFSGNGLTVDFTLSRDPGIINNTQVFVGGAYLRKDQYSLAGTTLTFDVAPASGIDNIEVCHSVALTANAPADGTVTADSFAADAISASIVHLLQSGTGAVATTVQAKLRESVSVLDFDATGDGTTDDTAAFSAAGSAGIKTVKVPAGTYNLVTNPTVSTDVTWYVEKGAYFNGNYGLNSSAKNIVSLGYWAGVSGAVGVSWLSNGTASSDPTPALGWIEKNATIGAFASTGAIGIAGAARTSQISSGAAIGVAGVGYNDNAANSVNVWASYLDAKSSATALGAVFGQEIGIATLGAYVDAYAVGNNKTIGLAIAAGADAAINGATNSVTWAIRIYANGATFGRGIDFGASSLRVSTDAGGINHSKAIVLRSGMQIGYENSSGDSLGFFRSACTTTTSESAIQLSNNTVDIFGYANAVIGKFFHTASAVNYLQFNNAITTGPPVIAAVGSDTNIDLRLSPQGTGVLRFGTWTTNADAAVNGYVTIKDSAGTTRKLATIA